jgi:adenosylcobinamide kinase / adenosylcobinamide-phosphate guanylyltransferase
MGLTLLLGGARSGKSRSAVRLAASWDGPVVVVATGEPRDEEMAARIARHRAERPPEWTTVEEPVDLQAAIAGVPAEAAMIVDCLTLWISNLMERRFNDDEVERRVRDAARVAVGRPAPTIAVSNEVGWGIVPMHPVSRRYRDLLGLANQAWAAEADRVLLLVAGRALRLYRLEEDVDDRRG